MIKSLEKVPFSAIIYSVNVDLAGERLIIDFITIFLFVFIRHVMKFTVSTTIVNIKVRQNAVIWELGVHSSAKSHDFFNSCKFHRPRTEYGSNYRLHLRQDYVGI